jgi:hypothetical protein
LVALRVEGEQLRRGDLEEPAVQSQRAVRESAQVMNKVCGFWPSFDSLRNNAL